MSLDFSLINIVMMLLIYSFTSIATDFISRLSGQGRNKQWKNMMAHQSFEKADQDGKCSALHSDSCRGVVTMTQPCMLAYSLLLIKTCHRRGVHAMGGMAAQIPIKNDAEANEAALTKVGATATCIMQPFCALQLLLKRVWRSLNTLEILQKKACRKQQSKKVVLKDRRTTTRYLSHGLEVAGQGRQDSGGQRWT